MAKTTTIPNVQNANMPDGEILNGTGTGKITIFTAGGNDSIIRSLGASSTDTADEDVIFYVNVGGAGSDRQICRLKIPLSSGNSNTVAAFDVFKAINAAGGYMFPLAYDAYGNRVWNLKAGTTIKAAAASTITSGKAIDFFGDGADF
jgi:hypothetical protein